MSFLISDAMAAAAGATSTGQGDGSFSMVMIVAIFVLFYFMLIRPQNRRAKEHRDMIGQIKKGDEIVTSGGLVGKVVDLGEQFIKMNLAEGVDVNVQRNAISTVLPKGTLKTL